MYTVQQVKEAASRVWDIPIENLYKTRRAWNVEARTAITAFLYFYNGFHPTGLKVALDKDHATEIASIHRFCRYMDTSRKFRDRFSLFLMLLEDDYTEESLTRFFACEPITNEVQKRFMNRVKEYTGVKCLADFSFSKKEGIMKADFFIPDKNLVIFAVEGNWRRVVIPGSHARMDYWGLLTESMNEATIYGYKVMVFLQTEINNPDTTDTIRRVRNVI